LKVNGCGSFPVCSFVDDWFSVTISLVKWGSCTQRFASGMYPAFLEEGKQQDKTKT